MANEVVYAVTDADFVLLRSPDPLMVQVTKKQIAEGITQPNSYSKRGM